MHTCLLPIDLTQRERGPPPSCRFHSTYFFVVVIVVLAIIDLESAGDTDSDYLSGDILMIGLYHTAYPC